MVWKERLLFLFREYVDGKIKLCSMVNGNIYDQPALNSLVREAAKKGFLANASRGVFWVLSEYIGEKGEVAWSLFRFHGLPRIPLNDNFHIYDYNYGIIRRILRMAGVEKHG